jgi:dCMP deaminase
MTETFIRPDWDTYFGAICKGVASRADCRRAQVGAVIVKNHRIVSTGYNGSPAGGPSCLDGECPRGLLSEEELASLTPDYSNCIALHSEMNAIAYASRSETEGATIYLSMDPCDMCAKLIKAAGIIRVVVG